MSTETKGRRMRECQESMNGIILIVVKVPSCTKTVHFGFGLVIYWTHLAKFKKDDRKLTGRCWLRRD